MHFPAGGKLVEDLQELELLATSAGALVVATVTGARTTPESKYFVGTGKAEEIRDAVAAHHADLVLFNHTLSPAQERNLEKLFNCRVLDRNGLILDIFAQRARSFEGKLQVELALLKHLSTRLVRGWTHLERQRGGIGLRGPGETQLETDRRLIRARIQLITKRLAKLRKQREQSRRARKKARVPTVALVGYTNAGKSTLFNRLTGAAVYVADQLFATLDPTLRRVSFPETGPIILADTVGFIRHLPPTLIAAFHATLEEVTEADLILHVIDLHDDDRDMHAEQVEAVLQSLEADTVPRLRVYNKIDLHTGLQPSLDRDSAGTIKQVLVSAATGFGMAELVSAMGEFLNKEMIECHVLLPSEDARLRADLYERGAVLAETVTEDGGWDLLVRISRAEAEARKK